jgi:uncharacterized iron-regulated protein
MGRIGTVLALAALGACSHGVVQEEHPLAGRIWDVRAGAFIQPAALLARLPGARHLILGETHDNPVHHRLQRQVLESLAAADRRTLAMEQFDTERQPALDAARSRNADAETLADSGQLDRKGWNWPLYKPLVQFALDHDWPIAAANLSRGGARRIVADPSSSGLAPAPAAVRAALEHDIVEGHCGRRPEAKLLAGMIEAQRARDSRMAEVIAAAPRTVLIAGSGHARLDRGVPVYLRSVTTAGQVVSIAFTEVEAGLREPQDYPQAFDYLWFTPRAVRDDPCKALTK